jgi:16S rRNA (uracil1498-N3)-methyltransferase
VRPRFYLPSIDASGHGELDDDETHHLRRVLRLVAGAEVDVFDGLGGLFHARVTELGRERARLEVTGPAPAAPEPRTRVTLVMSVLKGDKMDGVVRDAVMMGAAAILPVVALRSEVTLAALERGRRTARWQRIAVASVKQCGRAVVPVVSPPADVATWMETRREEPVLVLIEPSGPAAAALRDLPRSDAVHLVVGPEGGWSPDETASFARAGFTAVSLGGRTLRADVAPLVAMAAIYEGWNGW